MTGTSLKGKEKAFQDIRDVSDDESLPASSDKDSAYDSGSSSDEVTEEYLNTLLEKARKNARKAAQRRRGTAVEVDDGLEGDVIKLDGGGSSIESSKTLGNLPELDLGSIPNPYFVMSGLRGEAPTSVRDLDSEATTKAGSSIPMPSAPASPTATSKSGRPFTQQERKALRRATAGPDWYDLPAPNPADLPRLHREVEALRLRNTLDPKRFYRREEGEGRGMKGLPKFFAIGTVVATGSPFEGRTSSDLPRAQRKRTIVDELLDDAEAKRYAKRKFEDLQAVRSARGRGTLAKKKSLRQKKW